MSPSRQRAVECSRPSAATISSWNMLSSNSAVSKATENERSCVGHEAADGRGGDRGIEPAAQIGADRHVGAQADAHGVEQQRAHLLGEAGFLGRRHRSILGRIGILKAPVWLAS